MSNKSLRRVDRQTILEAQPGETDEELASRIMALELAAAKEAERAQRVRVFREYMQAPGVTPDSQTRLAGLQDRSKEHVATCGMMCQDYFDRIGDNVQTFVERRNNTCLNKMYAMATTLGSLCSPIRLRSDSDLARELDAQLNSEAHIHESAASRRDRRAAERLARQERREAEALEREDRLVAARLHGEEVVAVENRMLRRQFGSLTRLGTIDFMQNKEHYPYFCRIMSFILVIMLIVEIAVNGGFEPPEENVTLGPSIETMLALGAKKSDLIRAGEWWRLIAPMFLHAGVLHLGMNVLCLHQIGAPAEREYGSLKIMLIYFSAGLFGVTMSSLFIPGQVGVGASGAIFGLFGACWADLIQNWSLYRGNAYKVLAQLSIYTVVNFIFGLVPFVDNFQHLGGMVVGFFSGLGLLVHSRYSISGRLKAQKDYQVCLKYFSRVFVPSILIASLVALYNTEEGSLPCPGCLYLSCVPMPPGAEFRDQWWSCEPCFTGGIIQEIKFTVSENDANGLVQIMCANNENPFITEEVDAIPRVSDEADIREEALRLCKLNCVN